MSIVLPSIMQPMRWDIFCRVIDNLGDVGVCWRLASDLAARGEHVRLWLDDASALAWMAPRGAAGVEVLAWPDSAVHAEKHATPDVVVEAFGCHLPLPTIEAMARQMPAPAWINLEYLSAEDYVERSHGLPSPVHAGLVKWFYYPGFTPMTGGLLREPGLAAQQAAFDSRAWLAAHGIERREGERLVSLFCYDSKALPTALAGQPTLLLLTPGAATQQLQTARMPPGVRTQALPWLTQTDYDRLLWSCDINFVRGEDSLVRAQWAAKPFVWQIYPQSDGAHAAKLEAFLRRFEAAPEVANLWRAWNRLDAVPLVLPPAEPWSATCLAWREQLRQQGDLGTQLMRFVQSKTRSETKPRC